jgi:hypothetical protein
MQHQVLRGLKSAKRVSDQYIRCLGGERVERIRVSGASQFMRKTLRRHHLCDNQYICAWINAFEMKNWPIGCIRHWHLLHAGGLYDPEPLAIVRVC